jgi:hypothetical protein
VQHLANSDEATGIPRFDSPDSDNSTLTAPVAAYEENKARREDLSSSLTETFEF